MFHPLICDDNVFCYHPLKIIIQLIDIQFSKQIAVFHLGSLTLIC